MAPTTGQSGGGATVEQLPILPLRNQVIFPGIRGAVDLSKKAFDDVCAFMERTGASGIGALALRPSKKGPLESKGELFEVGTLCRLVSHSASDTKGASNSSKGSVRLVMEGRSRFRVLEIVETGPIRVARVQLLEEDPEADEGDVGVRALVHTIQEKMTELLKGGQDNAAKLLGGKRQQVRWPSSPSTLSSVIGATLVQLSIEERQKILETLDIRQRLEHVLDLLQRETEAKRMSSEISSNIQKSRENELRQMVLQRQMQEVQKDLQKLHAKAQRDAEGGEGGLGDGADGEEEEDEDARLGDKLAKVGLTEDATKIAKKELKRLKSIQPHHPEYTITHTYLELLSSLPWKTSSEDLFNISKARSVLDEDHRGLEKVKVRILEFLAVQKMRGNMKGPILCLHGPPGIGKTSLGRSIARSLGRKFHRIALGGVRDEAELRGHRRTYIGSIPGVIIQAFQTLGVNNPVILLDEVDKMSQNSMFNPQATLLEILDPEQNDSFKDHYLNTAFDLSKVLFICTANDTSLIDRPLLDRMEVIELSGYTVEEKRSITETHLLPKQRQLHALESLPAQVAPEAAAGEAKSAAEAQAEPAAKPSEPPAAPSAPRLMVTQEAVTGLVTKWTSESGVRSLERRLAQICRWAALRLQGIRMTGVATAERDQEREQALVSCGPDEQGVLTVDLQHLPHIIGVELFEPDIAERLSIGVAMGLSVSSVGGQLLFIEATRTPGHGKLTITGQLGKVMTESVETALSLLRSRFLRQGGQVEHLSSEVLNLLRASRAPGDSADGQESASKDRDPFKGEDIHVHFPAGGIPKDGPSAGVAVLLSLASLLLNRPMRSDTAVTGEVTLRGHVLPVGGIRDKVLAASRAGVRHVLLPLANKRNVLEDIPAKTLKSIEVHYVKHVDEALDWAFGKQGMSEAEVAALASSALPPGLPAAAAAARTACAGDGFVPPRARL